MSLELVLFVVIAAVAIISAALMLISKNAVHSALFLVVNLLCVAFFYLMLNAPFLAMVQVTVYAGAIMVLFMFVIMLLGAEKLSSQSPRYPWIAPGAVILTTVFLMVAFFAIVRGEINLLRAVAPSPQVRLIHAVAGAPAVDMYLNAEAAAQNVSFRGTSDLRTVRAGEYNLLVFPACELPNRAECPNPVTSGSVPLLAAPAKLADSTVTTYLVAGTPTSLQLIPIPTDLSTLADDATWRLTVVNALPGSGPVTLYKINRENRNNSPVVVPALSYGEVAPTQLFPRGAYDFEWRRVDQRLAIIENLDEKGKSHEILVLTGEPAPAVDGAGRTRPTLIRAEPAPTTLAYGSPMQMGVELLTTYLLPFELVALLLLAAMVGSIILTREEVIKRERRRLVVSPVVKRINRSMTDPAQLPAGTVAASQSNAETTSAD